MTQDDVTIVVVHSFSIQKFMLINGYYSLLVGLFFFLIISIVIWLVFAIFDMSASFIYSYGLDKTLILLTEWFNNSKSAVVFVAAQSFMLWKKIRVNETILCFHAFLELAINKLCFLPNF